MEFLLELYSPSLLKLIFTHKFRQYSVKKEVCFGNQFLVCLPFSVSSHLFFFFPLYLFIWRLITLQYCIGFVIH